MGSITSITPLRRVRLGYAGQAGITGMKTKKKVLITGGHFTPGLAVIPLLKERGWEVVWVGMERSLANSNSISLEMQTLPSLGVPFYKIETGKINRHSLLSNIENLWRLPLGFWQAFKLVAKIKPGVILSFGSFVSVPVCLVAYFLQIPIVIHEQTAASGLANRFISRLAKRVAISFISSKDEFPHKKTILTGNLLRESIFKIKKQTKSLGARPAIYITGGSRGSHIINTAVDGCLEQLLNIANITHQTGQLDFTYFSERKNKLGKLGANYKVAANFSTQDVEDVLKIADLAISRSGANTVSEFAVVGVPALFIPLPSTERDEQTKNAQVLTKLGRAKILNQSDLTPQRLFKNVQDMLKNLDQYKKNQSRARLLVPHDAPMRLITILEKAYQNEN